MLPGCGRASLGPVLLLLLALFPGTGRASQSVYEWARGLADAGRLTAALAVVESGLRKHPEDVDLRLLEGQILIRRGRFEEAFAVLERALHRAPDYRDLRILSARAAWFDGRRERALGILAPLLRAAPPDVEAWALAARIQVAGGNRGAARRIWARLASSRPDLPEPLLALGDLAREDGRLELAAYYYDRVLGLPGGAAKARPRLAQLAKEKRRFRLTLLGSYSDFDDGGRDDWRDGYLELSWRRSAATTLRLSTFRRHRFGESDAGALVGATYRLDARTWLEGGIGAAPGARFSPRLETTAGISRVLWRSRGRRGNTVGLLRGRARRYRDGTVVSLELGLAQYFFDGGSWLTGAFLATRDESGHFEPSLSIRGDLRVTPDLRLFAGSSLEEDELETGTVSYRTYFAGFSLDLDDRLRLLASAALADPDSGARRRSVELGISVAF